MTLEAGSLLGKNLRLDRVLGQGAMGTVWVAENIALGSEVAVKVLHHGVESEEARARFAQEARGVAAIDSPHVVTIFDYGVTDAGEPYIVMELLRGHDLRTFIEEEGPLSPSLTAQLVRQTARALGRAHKLGIIHRDIKPANIFLVDNDGEPLVKVLDFGVAKQLGGTDMHMTETGAMMGTPYYMSPEQLLDPRSVDARTDLWALGTVAYACLTASLPFVGETLGALSVAINTGDFEPPSARVSELPAGLDAWMARALARKPDERFATAREMADALLEAAGGPMSGMPMSAQPASAQPASAQPPSAQPPAQAAEASDAPSSAAADVAAAEAVAGAAAGGAAAVAGAAAAPSVASSAGGGRDAEAAAQGSALAVAATTADVAARKATASEATASEAAAASDGAKRPAPLSQPQAQGGGLGRMGLVALGAAVLTGGGVFAGVKLSAQPTAGVDSPAATAQADPSAESTAAASSASSDASSADSATPPEGTAVASGSSATAPPPAIAGAGSAGAERSAPAAGGAVSAATVKSAVLSCWNGNEGAKPDTPAAGVTVVLDRSHAWGSQGLAEVQGAPGFAPKFAQCARSSARQLLQQFRPGDGSQLRVAVALPGKQQGPAFPSEGEVRAGVAACWQAHDGSQPGTAPYSFRLRFQAKGGASGPGTSQASRQFARCVMGKVREWKNRGHDTTKTIDMTISLPAGPSAGSAAGG